MLADSFYASPPRFGYPHVTMTDPARAFAESVAAARGGRVVALPTGPSPSAWAVVAPSGAHALVVEHHAFGFGVRTGEGARVEPEDAVKAAEAGWDSTHVTMTEAALAVCEAGRAASRSDLRLSLPSGRQEVNVHGDVAYAHATDRGELLVPVDDDYEARPLGERSGLPGLVEWALHRIKLQHAAHDRDLALGVAAEAFARTLQASLERDVELPATLGWGLRASGRPDARLFELTWADPPRVACSVQVGHGKATVTAGALEADLAHAQISRVVESVRRRLSVLTRDGLVVDARYFLLQPFGGRSAGETVTYLGFDPRDNHWQLELFRAFDGVIVEVDVNDRVWRAVHEVLRPVSADATALDAAGRVEGNPGDAGAMRGR